MPCAALRPYMLARDVAHLMVEFNLLSVPVTDDMGRLVGIVTVDDAMDVLLPEEKHHHLRILR